MGVPGSRVRNAPPSVAGELFATDAYLCDFEAKVAEVDPEGRRIRLDRTAFYPGGGGQPCDVGTLKLRDLRAPVTGVRREGGAIWHTLEVPELPEVGAPVFGQVDWARRHQLMRTHTALHI